MVTTRRKAATCASALYPDTAGIAERCCHKAVLEAAGIPDAAIETRLGHAPSGISGVYSHVLRETEDRIVKVLPSRYEAATAA
ncbi:hypothetical protein FAGKG844_170031 [Frankia sp. AgKG'84/4]